MRFPYAYYRSYFDGQIHGKSFKGDYLQMSVVTSGDSLISSNSATLFMLDTSSQNISISSIEDSEEGKIIKLTKSSESNSAELMTGSGSGSIILPRGNRIKLHYLKTVELMCVPIDGELRWMPVAGFDFESNLGDLAWSFLEEADYQNFRDSTWVIPRGQSIAGTDLHALTGMATLPDSTDAFLSAIGTGTRTAGSFEPYTTALPQTPYSLSAYSHNHGGGNHRHGGNVGKGSYSFEHHKYSGRIPLGSWQSATDYSGAIISWDNHSHSISGGDDKTAPDNIAANLFVKVNY